METAAAQQAQGIRLYNEAAALEQNGAESEALRTKKRAALYFLEAERLAEAAGEMPSSECLRAHAEAASGCGIALKKAGRAAEATLYFQEAADAWGRLSPGSEKAHDLALAALECLKALEGDRLDLLLLTLEHKRELLALRPRSQEEQAESAAHIAAILTRRNRPQEAAAHYLEAAELYADAVPSPSLKIKQAECLHRLAGLYAYSLHNSEKAIEYYLEAISLYRLYETPYRGVQQSCALCLQALEELRGEEAGPPAHPSAAAEN